MGAALEAQGFGQFEEPFRLGEVSFHSGWTFHRAGLNCHPRRYDKIIIEIYIDSLVSLTSNQNKN